MLSQWKGGPMSIPVINGSRMFLVICCAVLFTALAVGVSCHSTTATPTPLVLELEGDLRVHDPVIIREKNTYYVFSTGLGPGSGIIPIRCSNDLHHWTLCGRVFDRASRMGVKRNPGGERGVGSRHLLLQRQVPPILLCFYLWQE